MKLIFSHSTLSMRNTGLILALLIFVVFISACKKSNSVNKEPDNPTPPPAVPSIAAGELVKRVEAPLSADLIFSKGVYLIRNSVMQSFDVDSKGTIYYNQVGGQLAHIIFAARGLPNQTYNDSMQLKYTGHGTNVAIEEAGEDRYLWIATNGHKGSDGEYGSSKTFSRIKYVPNTVVESYGGDTFYLPGHANVHPAIDMKNDLLAITSSGSGDGIRYFFIYRLSKVMNIPLKTMKLPKVKFGGEESGVPEQTVERSVELRDLSDIAPIVSFGVSPGAHEGLLNSYSFQGFDINADKIFFYEGGGNDNVLANGPSKAYLTVLNRKGFAIGKRTPIKAISDLTLLNTFGITATGYMEPESLKMKDGVLYLGFASRSTDDRRLANIFAYK